MKYQSGMFAIIDDSRLEMLLNLVGVAKNPIENAVQRSLLPYKVAAAALVNRIKDEKNYQVLRGDVLHWKQSFHIFESMNYEVGEVNSFGASWDTIIEHTDTYPHVMYLLAAARNARQEVAELTGAQLMRRPARK